MDPYSLILVFAAMIALFYFMNKNQRRRQEQAQEMMKTMEPGSWVMTSTGFYGQLIDIDGDVAILETADGTETYWARQVVTQVKEPPFAADSSTHEDFDNDMPEDDEPSDISSDDPDSHDEQASDSSSSSK